jgi:hypothetical protein
VATEGLRAAHSFLYAGRQAQTTGERTVLQTVDSDIADNRRVVDGQWIRRDKRYLPCLARRLRDSIGQEGLGRFLLRAASNPVYRVMEIQAEPIEASTPIETALLHLATEDDIPALVAFRPEYDARELQQRIQAGERCFFSLVDGGSPLAAGWRPVRCSFVGSASSCRWKTMSTASTSSSSHHRTGGRASPRRCTMR